VSATEPAFGPGVGDRFTAARTVAAEDCTMGRAVRRRVQAWLRPLLVGGAVLVYPTSPAPAPLLAASPTEQARVRALTLRVTAIAGLAGLPEVTLPAGTVEGLPVGLSLVGGTGCDRALLGLAKRAAEVLGLG